MAGRHAGIKPQEVPSDTKYTDHLLQHLHRLMPAEKLLMTEFKMAWIHAWLHRNISRVISNYINGGIVVGSTIKWLQAMGNCQILDSSQQPLPIQSLKNIHLCDWWQSQKWPLRLSQRHIWTKLFIFTSGLASLAGQPTYPIGSMEFIKQDGQSALLTMNNDQWLYVLP